RKGIHEKRPRSDGSILARPSRERHHETSAEMPKRRHLVIPTSGETARRLTGADAPPMAAQHHARRSGSLISITADFVFACGGKVPMSTYQLQPQPSPTPTDSRILFVGLTPCTAGHTRRELRQ